MGQMEKPAKHLLCKYTIEVCASRTLWVGMDGASGYENFLGVGALVYQSVLSTNWVALVMV